MVYYNMSKSGYIFLVFLLSVMLLGFTESDSRLKEGKKNYVGDKPTTLLKTGDIIFQTSLSDQSKAIQLATKSRYSHVGIVYQESGKDFVLEAVQPVKLTLLEKWIDRGAGKHYAVKRLKKNIESNLKSQDYSEAIKRSGKKWIGTDYDVHFEWTDDKLYCSELVWKVYKRALNVELAPLQSFKELDLEHPLVQSKVEERFKGNLSLDEKIISPEQLYQSDKLEFVFQN